MNSPEADTDIIVFTTEDGAPTGETGPKLASHHAHTKVHLAFSVFVFNDADQVLITQRAHVKKVWPMVWTGTCCGHPFPGESLEDAIHRRLRFELGMTADRLTCVIPKYRYTTPPYHGVVENEFCPIYTAHATSTPNPNPAEVEAFRWMSWDELRAEATTDGSDYSRPDAPDAPRWSYWMKDQLAQLPPDLSA